MSAPLWPPAPSRTQPSMPGTSAQASPDAGPLLALHVLLPGPPQPPRHRIEGDRHMEVGPTDLNLPGHGRPERCPHLAHRVPQAQAPRVAPHDPLPRLQADRGQALPEPPFCQVAWAWGSVCACRGRGTFRRTALAPTAHLCQAALPIPRQPPVHTAQPHAHVMTTLRVMGPPWPPDAITKRR